MTRPILLLAALAMLAAGAQAQDLSAYPNPYAGGPFTVQTDAPDAAFELLDVLGRRVDARQTLAPGAYLWRLRYADGSRSTAQRLTVLTPGPLDVRLVSTPGGQAAAPALAPVSSASLASAARGGGCAPSPGGALFGGFYHAPAPGVEIEQTANLMTVRGTEGAGFSTCLPGVSGFNIGMTPSASAFRTGSGTAIIGTHYGGDVSGEPFSASFLLEEDSTPSARRGGGASATLRGGVDASSPRLVEVIRYDTEGAPQVVASAVIPGGTPLSTPFALASNGGVAGITLENVTATGWKIEEGSAVSAGTPHTLRDDVFVAQFDFGTDDPSGLLTFQIPGATVQGHALALTAQIDGLLSLGLMSADASTTEFQVEALGFAGFSAETTVRPALAVPAGGIPAWMQMQDPNGLMTDAGTMEIRCGQGQTCASYGVEVAPSFGMFGHETSLKTAPESIVSAPSAAALYGGPFESAPGRGLLLDRLDEFRSDAYYRYELTNLQGGTQAVQRRAVATIAKPRENKTSVRVDDLAPDALAGGDTPAFSRFRLRYIKNGRVRLNKVFVPGRTYVFKARLEVLDAIVTQGDDGPLFRYAISLNGGEEFLELEPILDGDPTVTGYQKIEWTYTEPWSLGVAGWDEGVAARPAPWAEGASEDWVFEIE